MWYLITCVVILQVVNVLCFVQNNSLGDRFLIAAVANLCLVILMAMLGFPALKLTTGLLPNYSTGEREGYLTKLSVKGVIWKTTEAELQVGAGEMAALQEPWAFSIPDSKLLQDEAQQNLGKRVRVTYHEWLILPWRHGETSYLMIKMEPVT